MHTYCIFVFQGRSPIFKVIGKLNYYTEVYEIITTVKSGYFQGLTI